MGDIFKVAIHHGNDNGYIEYNSASKKVTVVLADENKRKEVEKYLASTHIINVPHKTLVDFSAREVKPYDSVEDFKLALTKIWESIGIHVDWSRPVA